jgi:hypothetical protein
MVETTKSDFEGIDWTGDIARTINKKNIPAWGKKFVSLLQFNYLN